MSIMESIEAAEQQAELIRREARGRARELLREAETQSRAQADRRIAEAKESARQMIGNAQEEARLQTAQELAQWEQQQQALAQAARVKLPAAIQAIVEEALR